MANVITGIDTQATEQFDLYLKPLLADPKINALPFDILVGKFKNRELYFNTNLDKISSKKVACGWDFSGSTEFTKKTVTPVEIQAAVEQCYTELVNTIFANGMADGFKRGELSPEVLNFLLEQQQYAFNRDLLSILFLGDESISDTYYSSMDGVYVKLAAGAAAVDGTVDVGAITASDVNTTNFFATMNEVWRAQSRQLKGVANERKTWIWTQALYDAYIDYLESSTQGTAGVMQTAYVTDGLAPLKFKGINIVVPQIVDERLEADFLTGSPAEPENPYRSILTVGDNHKVILDGTGFMQQAAWYSQDDDKYRIAGSALLAYEYGYGELNVIAGF